MHFYEFDRTLTVKNLKKKSYGRMDDKTSVAQHKMSTRDETQPNSDDAITYIAHK